MESRGARGGDDVVNISLAKSIVDAVGCPCVRHAAVLKTFSERSWRRSYHWIVTSGLALHLLAALKECERESSLPDGIAARLRRLDDASGVRTDDLRRDFLQLNARFAALGVPYANWKGFALEPDFCRDIRFRPQMDFDFIVYPEHSDVFDIALRGAGYQKTRTMATELSYETMPGRSYTLEQVYHPKPQRKVELHLAADHPSHVTPAMDLHGALQRRREAVVHGEVIAVLAVEDAFLSHAAHAGRHALDGWVRLGWLHEIDYFIRLHHHDSNLWSSVRSLADHPDAPVASAAVGILLANRLCRGQLPDGLRWIEEVLPEPAVRWMDRHGERLVMAEFPGTKLGLLLQRELIVAGDWRKVERDALFGRRPIPRVAHIPQSATMVQRIRAVRKQSRFIVRRLRFHCVETARYLLLKWRWSRPAPINAGVRPSCNGAFKAHSDLFDG